MNKLSGKLSVFVKKSICLLGLVSVGNFMAAPANAGQAAARSAVTIVRPSGASQSVSGEVLLPAGMYFNPTYFGPGSTGFGNKQYNYSFAYTNAGTNTESISSLSIDAGTPTAAPATGVNPFVNAAADKLKNSNNSTEDTAAIIKAGAGVNGLGGLE